MPVAQDATIRTFLAPAKVNLALRVVGRRSDGFHLLWTILTFFPLYDTLRINHSAALELTCDPPVTDHPENNLVWKTARRLQQETGYQQGAKLHLSKRIPHGAGLGGGSSDAATTLLALNKLWKLELSLPQLLQIGVQLGADIPFFLGGVSALAEGIGERLTPLPHLANVELVVVNPGFVLATAQVFRKYSDQKNHWDWRSTEAYPPSKSHQQTVLPLLVNDLEEVAIQMVPEIHTIADALRKLGARATLMSGSGSSLFGIFSDNHSATEAAKRLRQVHPEWQIFTGLTFNRHPFDSE